ncbi:MAG: rod shape-determining protein [Negativicutes bacterium]|nr:rod shape-determining protein [Negativicutes bacterium]
MTMNPLFALDIGTRSVVGIVGRLDDQQQIVVQSHYRLEHRKRAMLDGQIHDVPEVARVLAAVRKKLSEAGGPLTEVAVAAAGRALLTTRADAELHFSPASPLSRQDEHAIELLAVQAAQRQLALSYDERAAAQYYCVGYSVISYHLDDYPLKSLVGQTGRHGRAEIVATFLPRQVIDSLQVAVNEAGMEIASLTLEPIAAIHLLVPDTMRHLNLVLVDVGAGTSDIAVTSDGAIVAYGMVPHAGDEITEELSQQYLLDFNEAEWLKIAYSRAAEGAELTARNVLGREILVARSAVAACVDRAVARLADEIGREIIQLNGKLPQAVLLVGGGAMTPNLDKFLAGRLGLPTERIAVRRPDTVGGFLNLPEELSASDAVTPLGIIALAGRQRYQFITVTVNGERYRLFNLGRLTVADGLLAAGSDLRRVFGQPGKGLTVTINGQTRTVPGTLNQPGEVRKNGEVCAMETGLDDGDVLTVVHGVDGSPPQLTVADLLPVHAAVEISVNGKEYRLDGMVSINGRRARYDTPVGDRDVIVTENFGRIGEILQYFTIDHTAPSCEFFVNGERRQYQARTEIRLNGQLCGPDQLVSPGDRVEIEFSGAPTVGELVNEDCGDDQYITLTFNGQRCDLAVARNQLLLDGQEVEPHTRIYPRAELVINRQRLSQPIVSDVLLAAGYQPPLSVGRGKIFITVNGRPAEFITPVAAGDEITIGVTE